MCLNNVERVRVQFFLRVNGQNQFSYDHLCDDDL